MPGPLDLLRAVDVVDPYPTWQALADGPPVVAEDGSFALVTGLAECSALLRHPALSSDHRNGRYFKEVRSRGLTAEDLQRLERREAFLFRDPPVHTRLRRMVSKAFTPRTVDQLHPYVEKLTDELLAGAADRGRLEVVGDLAYPLPVAVISEMLGVPREDHATFAGWSELLAKSLDALMTEPTEDERRAQLRASDEFRDYIEALCEQRRRQPREDLLSALVAVEEEGDRLTKDELVSTALLLLVAGHETTVNLIGNGMLALLRVPGLHQRLREDPSCAGGVVEEVLRLDPPVQLTARTALEDVEVPGGTVTAGGTVVLLLAAAGRDARAFADPLRFDPDRGDARHLAFGGGIHYCLGAPLARLEGRVALTALARTLDRPRLVDLAYRDNRVLRGPSRLLVRDEGAFR
ncbi:MAG: cytochrome P450 [Mycobacteriales bacterium]